MAEEAWGELRSLLFANLCIPSLVRVGHRVLDIFLSCVPIYGRSFSRIVTDDLCLLSRLSLRRKSLQLSKSLGHSMGGYLPSTLTEMWEPSRAFAWFKLPSAGARTVVGMSG